MEGAGASDGAGFVFMTDLMRYTAELAAQSSRSLPPVDKWNPEYCGELDLLIRRDGVWIHEGTPIGRAPLVRLFSTVIRREGDKYFLVTPVEKLGIRVEDAPFVAVLMRRGENADRQRLIFTTNVGEEVVADADHSISYRVRGKCRAPYLHVRAGLDALIVRSVFYDLVAIGETRDIDGEEWFGVASSGVFFPFARTGEMDAGEV